MMIDDITGEEQQDECVYNGPVVMDGPVFIKHQRDVLVGGVTVFRGSPISRFVNVEEEQYG